jgi:cation transport regulator
MPYRTNEDLPNSDAHHLLPHAQDFYRAAFNRAFAAHAGPARRTPDRLGGGQAFICESRRQLGRAWAPADVIRVAFRFTPIQIDIGPRPLISINAGRYQGFDHNLV